MKLTSGNSLNSNKLTIGKLHFAFIEKVNREHEKNQLEEKINHKSNECAKDSKTSIRFINHCIMCLGLFNSLFRSCQALTNVQYLPHQELNMNCQCNYDENYFYFSNNDQCYNRFPAQHYDNHFNSTSMNAVNLDAFSSE